jgi:hypothetical protein
MMSSETWKAVPMISPNRRSASTCGASAPENIAPNRPAVAINEPVFSATTAM